MAVVAFLLCVHTLSPHHFWTSTDCPYTGWPAYIDLGFLSLVVILFLSAVYQVRDVSDINFIRLGTLISFGVGCVLLVPYVAGWLPEVAILTWYAFNTLYGLLFPHLVAHIHGRRAAFRLTGAGGERAVLTVDELLGDPELCREFERFCMQDSSVENIKFLQALASYRALPTPEKRDTLFRVFLLADAPLEINITWRTREMLMGSREGSLDPSLFDSAETEIRRLLGTDTLPKFRSFREGGASFK